MVLTGHEAKAQTDSLYYELDSTRFTSRKHSSAIKRSDPHVSEIDIDKIQSLPKILGNTDPVGVIKNLPGVQTGSEYDSGIHIQGCDNAHNDISLAGVPVYGANHLFGFFSVFNPSHFGRMSFSRTAEGNRLGGTLRMEIPDTLIQGLTGDISAGIMSSQGSLGFRTGEKSCMKISARQSYMNLLYKRWLKIEDDPIRYGFGDYNIRWMFRPSDRDKIWIEGYYGQDKAVMSEHNFNVCLDILWGNHSGSVHWEHTGSVLQHRHILFISGYRSNGLMSQNESYLGLNSYINTWGYKGAVQWKDFIWNAEINMHDILPQSPESDGLYGNIRQNVIDKQRAVESSISSEYRKALTDRWSIDAGIRGTYYISPEMRHSFSLSPKASISYNGFHLGKLNASYAMHHQYLFLAGLSNIGLPIEFWFAAGSHSSPQYSHQADISYDLNLFHDALALSVNAYYKRLYNQAEYKGDMFDFFNSRYDLDKHLLKGDGWNYGMNFMLHKQTGSVTGWISYSIGRALRRFDNKDYSGIYPANHERIHELNAVCSYQRDRWNFSGTFVYASGLPFTAPEYYYISAGQIITKPGDHNACRMRPYMRMDLSVTFSITKNEKQENGINFSLYNALGRKNDVMYRLNLSEGKYSYGGMVFFLRWVPSISYFHKF